MFTVYHSNQLDLLNTLAAALIMSSPLRDPFQPEVILIQSNEMAQWIEMELAEHVGISANINFFLPASFIWHMFTRVLPDIPEKNVFTTSSMTWRLMALLPRLCQKANFSLIGEYLCHDNDQRKLFQFATYMEDLFNQYSVYRPAWLEIWQRGEMIGCLGDAEYWQAPLWQALMEEIEKSGKPRWHYANLYQRFIQILTTSRIRPPGLPDRVFVCGISALPPTYLQVLQALGYHIDIHLFFTNPCRYYWGDICDQAFFERLLHRRRRHYQQHTEQELFRHPEQVAALLDAVGEQQQANNPLLASWGKQGHDNLYLLAQLNDIAEIDAFVEPTGDNLLSLVQRDILFLENHAIISMDNDTLNPAGIGKRPLQLDDRSLSLHACHSPQREVEVLHDSLLAMIVEDPTLRPRDIIVMVADINCYTPVVQAVFGRENNDRYLPFTISDRHARHLHPILPAFLSLLKLPHSRFHAEEVLALLEVPEMAAHFFIDEQGLQLLRRWVAESGIRWGLDDNTLHALTLPATGQHTWQFGLTRMLLGYAMDSQSGEWQGILPYDESSGLIAELVGQLAELLMRLRYWRDQLAQPRTLDDWLGCANEIIEDFFTLDTESETALALLKNYWKQIVNCGLEAGYDQPVSVMLLHDKLAALLDQERLNKQFLTGTINFCSLTPMRSIPFRVVCLLGMNDGVFPRAPPVVKFDLMAQQPQRGDRNQSDDDRYVFLESLLLAQQRLYISFIGHTIQDNALRYPSVLVSELIDYIAQSFYLPGDENADAEISADRVRTHLCQWHSRMPFAPENFLSGSEFQSFADEWLPAAERAKGEINQNFVVPLTTFSRKMLALDELLSFYRHPVRAWFVQRLGIYFDQTALKLTSSEPFIIDDLTRHQLNDRLVNTLIEGEDVDQLFHQVRAAGLLPHGAFGELYWTKQCQEMSLLSEQVRIWRLPQTHNIEVFLTLDGITLSGWLPQVQENGLLRWYPGTLSPRDGLLLWVEHLSYCAMGGAGASQLFGMHGGKWHFAPIPTRQAKEFLLFLISGYFQGMASPLLLLPRASSAWLSACYDPITRSIDHNETRQRQACDKLIQAWQGNDHVSGESQDPYLQRLIRKLEKKHIEEIILATKQYFLPPCMFNITQNTSIKSKIKT